MKQLWTSFVSQRYEITFYLREIHPRNKLCFEAGFLIIQVVVRYKSTSKAWHLSCTTCKVFVNLQNPPPLPTSKLFTGPCSQIFNSCFSIADFKIFMRWNTRKNFCHWHPNDMLVKENREVATTIRRLGFAEKALEASYIPHIPPSWVLAQNLWRCWELFKAPLSPKTSLRWLCTSQTYQSNNRHHFHL